MLCFGEKGQKSDFVRQNRSKIGKLGWKKGKTRVLGRENFDLHPPPPGREFVSIGKIWKNRGKIGLSSKNRQKYTCSFFGHGRSFFRVLNLDTLVDRQRRLAADVVNIDYGC